MALLAYSNPRLDPLGFYRRLARVTSEYKNSEFIYSGDDSEYDANLLLLSDSRVLQLSYGHYRDLTSSQMEAEYVRRWRHKGNGGYISTLYRCPTDNATDLCIYDIADKLKTNNTYDIGGTYTDDEPDFWFYYTTSVCHGFNFLLNLFVLPRKPGCFSLFLPKSTKLSSQIKTNDGNLAITCSPQTQLTFRTTNKDEHVYVKTFLFDGTDIATLEKCMLLVPLTFQLHSKLQLNPNTVRTIKLRHDLSSLMSQKESTDFTLISCTGKKYPVHKVLLAAHSPILRCCVDNLEQTITLDVTDDAMEIIIEFLYTGTLKNLFKQDYMMLLAIAEKLQLERLFSLAQQLLGEEINIQNAISVAVIAKKYELDNLTLQVFEFIKAYPEVLTTDSWHGFEDIDLVKQLLKHLHPASQNVD